MHTYKFGTYLDIQRTTHVFNSYWLSIAIILAGLFLITWLFLIRLLHIVFTSMWHALFACLWLWVIILQPNKYIITHVRCAKHIIIIFRKGPVVSNFVLVILRWRIYVLTKLSFFAIWRKLVLTKIKQFSAVTFAGGKFCENVGNTFHVGVIFMILPSP